MLIQGFMVCENFELFRNTKLHDYSEIVSYLYLGTDLWYFDFIFISDENIVNCSGNALIFHPRCGASVSLFNGYRSAHRPRYG